ncbi:hypothetical protein HLB23_27630 [Nocardia uniformis]|uniref:Uncharacterized protein n=1 Tax=Nocardia uniformis TaxID=53432 RepID=A0A849CB78_9NOCA|nr:hypothetical protein [Nocardia uniformis]NNH73580.1 hypothetical protein [Nocardia uniformis]
MKDEDRAKLANARTGGPMAFHHSAAGLRPVGHDGWPLTDEELTELDRDVADALSLLSGGLVIDVEPVSEVSDTGLR